MTEAAQLDALTSEQIVKLTRETNYGTWRFQKTWKPCPESSKAVGSKGKSSRAA